MNPSVPGDSHPVVERFRSTLSYLRWRFALRPGAPSYEEWVDAHRDLRPPGGSSWTGTITVITPVLDTPPELLRRCVGSVRRQTFRNWEHVLVDGGTSSSSTLEQLARIAGEPGVVVVRQRGGISTSTNAAVAAASGRFIAFLDHDDELDPTALEWISTCLPEADIVYTDQDEIDLDGDRSWPFFKPAWSPRLLLSLNYVNHLLCVRRDLLGQVGGFRSSFDGAQDHDLLLRLWQRQPRVAHIPHVLYHWRRWKGSTSSNIERTIEDRAMRAIREALRERGIRAAVRVPEPFRYRISPSHRSRVVHSTHPGDPPADAVILGGPVQPNDELIDAAVWLEDREVLAVTAGVQEQDGISSDALGRFPREVDALGGWVMVRASDLERGQTDDPYHFVRSTRSGSVVGVPDATFGSRLEPGWDSSPHVTDEWGAIKLRPIARSDRGRVRRLTPRWSGGRL